MFDETNEKLQDLPQLLGEIMVGPIPNNYLSAAVQTLKESGAVPLNASLTDIAAQLHNYPNAAIQAFLKPGKTHYQAFWSFQRQTHKRFCRDQQIVRPCRLRVPRQLTQIFQERGQSKSEILQQFWRTVGDLLLEQGSIVSKTVPRVKPSPKKLEILLQQRRVGEYIEVTSQYGLDLALMGRSHEAMSFFEMAMRANQSLFVTSNGDRYTLEAFVRNLRGITDQIIRAKMWDRLPIILREMASVAGKDRSSDEILLSRLKMITHIIEYFAYEKALPLFETIFEITQMLSDRVQILDGLLNLASVLNRRGFYQLSRTSLEAAIQLVHSMDDDLELRISIYRIAATIRASSLISSKPAWFKTLTQVADTIRNNELRQRAYASIDGHSG